ncbi:MAG: beta-lactamase family protein [Acetatifactor sp.]|nr:beta-lactamase family protein [Acetatifactor sp.]
MTWDEEKRKILSRFPGVSIVCGTAGGEARTEVYGVSDKESGTSVERDTVFPGCSVSKFVTALIVMRMQESKMIDIDCKVNDYLRQWKLLTPNGKLSEATIRSILCHTAGIVDDEDGFCGWRREDPEIRLADVLDGTTKYNQRPVVAEMPLGMFFEYSDAGYCVLQQMIEDVTGKAYDEAAKEMVFKRLGLSNTFFATPQNVADYQAKMTTGYDEEGNPIPGRFPVIPDLAASGLWSTGEELLTIASEFSLALQGKSTFLRRETALEMIKPVEKFTWTGLGVFLEGEETVVSRGWGENGQCMIKLDVRTGEICIVMTNANPGVDQADSGIEWLVNHSMTMNKRGN